MAKVDKKTGKVGYWAPFSSKFSRVGLRFPIARLRRYLKQKLVKREIVSKTAAVYIAAVLEYLTFEIMDLAGYAAQVHRVRRINPRHIMLAIRCDQELDPLAKGVIPSGGVVPHVHRKISGMTREELQYKGSDRKIRIITPQLIGRQ